MIADSLKEMLASRPFESFEIVMSSGQRHRVKHPECAIVTKTQMVIVDPEKDAVSIHQLLHVATVERIRSRRSKTNPSA